MKPKNTNLIDEIRTVIWITEKSKTNDKVNILKKSNQRTGIPIPKLKELLEKHTGKYWKVEDLAVHLKPVFNAYKILDKFFNQ